MPHPTGRIQLYFGKRASTSPGISSPPEKFRMQSSRSTGRPIYCSFICFLLDLIVFFTCLMKRLMLVHKRQLFHRLSQARIRQPDQFLILKLLLFLHWAHLLLQNTYFSSSFSSSVWYCLIRPLLPACRLQETFSFPFFKQQHSPACRL